MVATVTGQRTVPFGDGVVATPHTSFGWETCQELWSPIRYTPPPIRPPIRPHPHIAHTQHWVWMEWRSSVMLVAVIMSSGSCTREWTSYAQPPPRYVWSVECVCVVCVECVWSGPHTLSHHQGTCGVCVWRCVCGVSIYNSSIGGRSLSIL